MQKVPVYIGVFVQDNKIASKQIRNALMSGMQQLLQNHPQDELTEQIISDMSNFQQTFKPPADNYHITSLFIGGNAKKLNPQQLKQFNSFKSNQKAIIKIDCIIYVPGYIVCGYCSDTDGVEVDNRYAHVTLYLGNGANAVESNSVIESLAEKNKEMLEKKQFKSGKYAIDYNKHKWAFVIANRIQLKGVTGTNFTHGKR